MPKSKAITAINNQQSLFFMFEVCQRLRTASNVFQSCLPQRNSASVNLGAAGIRNGVKMGDLFATRRNWTGA
jgi:hypothetical protein